MKKNLLLIIFIITSAQDIFAKPLFLTTINPVTQIIRELTGQRARVVQLIPTGASPELFDPGPRDVKLIQKARAFFFVSKNLDAWLLNLNVINPVEMISLVPQEKLMKNIHSHGAGHEEHFESVGHDPHFWTDPVLVRDMLPGLVRVLCRLDGAGCKQYHENGRKMAGRLDTLHQELETMLRPIMGKGVILFHPSFQYFLRRYKLKLAGVIVHFPGKEPSPKYLIGIINKIKKYRIQAIFSEPQLPLRPAQVISEAAGVPLFLLDPLGGQKNYQSYYQLLETNARTFVKALR